MLADADVQLPPLFARVFVYASEKTRFRLVGGSGARSIVRAVASRVAERLEEEGGFGGVVTAWADDRPFLDEAIAALAHRGYRRVVVAELAVAETPASERARRRVDAMRPEAAGVRVSYAPALWTSAALAEHLQSRHGLYLNGVMLISSVLDLGSIGLHEPEDRGYANFLPTYAAVAHYHGKHGRKSLKTVLAEAEAYAARDYPWVLSRGNRLTAAERADAVTTLARLTGLSPDYVERADLRIEHVRFFTELLRDQRLAVGRLDSRFTGPLGSGLAEQYDADPSHDAIAGPYAAAWNHYVRSELGYESDLPYEQISAKASEEWSFKEFEGKAVNVAPKLARAMRANPHLRVHVAYGYHDGATPYFAAQDVLAHLQIPQSLSANIEHAYYEAGHMMYVHEPSRLQQSRDLADFVQRAAG
jgi:carboxypeptidase C (cathepsin A)